MKRYPTIFLKAAVIFIGIPVFAACMLGLSFLVSNPVNPDYAYMLYPILIGIYVSVIPFFIALYQTLRLLAYIDKNKAFSQVSIKALKNIKCCAITISILYVILMPLVYLVAEKDDSPGLIIMAMVPIFASMVIAVFAAVLQALLQDAIDIKSENDLTI